MKYILISLLSILLIACSSQKMASDVEDKSAINWNYSKSKASIQTNQLIEAMQAHNQKYSGSFVPSEEEIKKFNLQKIEDSFYLGALLKMNKDASTNSLEQLGVKIGTQAGDIWTAKVPLNQLLDVLRLEDIIYLDNSTTINTK